jgi:hypothetical protein
MTIDEALYKYYCWTIFVAWDMPARVQRWRKAAFVCLSWVGSFSFLYLRRKLIRSYVQIIHGNLLTFSRSELLYTPNGLICCLVCISIIKSRNYLGAEKMCKKNVVRQTRKYISASITLLLWLSYRHIILIGRAVAQRLDAGFPPRRPGFAYG